MAINFHRKLHWQVFIMKHGFLGIDNTSCRTFSSCDDTRGAGREKCIHLCNLHPQQFIFFVSQDFMHCMVRNGEGKVYFLFLCWLHPFPIWVFFCLFDVLKCSEEKFLKFLPGDTFSSHKQQSFGDEFSLGQAKKGKIYFKVLFLRKDNLLQFLSENKGSWIFFRQTWDGKIFLILLKINFALRMKKAQKQDSLSSVCMQMNNTIKIQNSPASN